jgi:hypothetical protein
MFLSLTHTQFTNYVDKPTVRSDETTHIKTEDDNLLSGQDYHIPHMTVIDEYGAMVEW